LWRKFKQDALQRNKYQPLSIVPILSGDEDCIVRLWIDAGLHIIDEREARYEFSEMIRVNPTSCLKALIEDNIVGTIFGTWNGRRAWMYRLAVLPAYQHQGIGTRLMRSCIEVLHKAGAHKVIVSVAYENEKTCAFYERLGFEVMDDAYLMAREIS